MMIKQIKAASNRAEGSIFTRSDATTLKTKDSNKEISGMMRSAGSRGRIRMTPASDPPPLLSLKEGASSHSDWLRGGHKLPSIISRFHSAQQVI